ncbi:hypothetical protein MTR67_047702 [Solanum verrucosum]|uniref:Uncharacterized protein n=1 Tax=Solanum verrucosum TaxID=315347 RepID=A0AAF0ZVU7_SOLVR|nr:hypothetical protein MTR67_047702 [Solanum verrucosum]
MDRLTKSPHFILMITKYNAEQFVRIYIHEIDRCQFEQTIQVLEDMLLVCVMDIDGHWDQSLPLVECSHNNSYHSSIQMTSFESLYGNGCRSPIGWFDSFGLQPWGTDLLRDPWIK